MGQAQRRVGETPGATGRKPLRWVVIAAAIAGVACLGWWLAGGKKDAPAAVVPPPPVVAITPVLLPDDKVHAGYVGSESCKACHAEAYEKWKTSNHHFAERLLQPQMDHAAFSPARTIAHGRQTSEAKLDEKGLAQFITLGQDNTKKPYTIRRVIAHDPLRQFLVEFPGGRLQALEQAWDPHKSEWFDIYGDEDRKPGEWGHWTGRGMNWNAQCAGCHNTRVRKNYDPATDTYQTRMAEMTVGCESCHGPMKEHVDWQGKKPVTGDKPVVPKKDPTVKKLTRDQMLETCAACHARRGELTGDLVPGESFYDHFNLMVPDGTEVYYPDGQVHEEDYEFTAFLGSKMHAAGVRCVDCHDAHTGKTQLVGNALCMQCHSGIAPRPGVKLAPTIDPVAHSRHGEASTGNQCVSCHMPVTDYMQRHPRHDHGFTIPDPQLTKDHAIPNACNRCHTDKDTEWAIKATNNWYGEKMNRSTRSRAILFAKARQGDPATRAQLIALLKQPNEPLWQASASHLLGNWLGDPEVSRALLAQFKHPSPLVREAAVRAVGALAQENDATIRSALTPMLEDEFRGVRIAAAWMSRDTLDLDSRAGRELTHMLQLGADQPTGQMQLGQYEFSRNNPKGAIAHFRKAVEWDPNSPPFHHDLAVALSMTGDTNGAIRELQKAVTLSPETADYHYKLALAWNEAGSLENAIASLEETVKRDPEMGRAWYNLSVAYLQSGKKQQALTAAQRAAQLDPRNPRVIQLLQSLGR